MDPVKWTDAAQAIAACGSLLVTLFGFLFVLRQLRQVERNIRGETNASLCHQSIEILKAMMSRQECYPFFYDNKPLPEDHPHRVEILCLTEMIANYLDLVALQKDNLPPTAWTGWHKFILDTLQMSPVVREHLTKYGAWCSTELQAIVKQAKPSA